MVAMGTIKSQEIMRKFLELRESFAKDLEDVENNYKKDSGVRNQDALAAAKEYSRTMDVLVSRMSGTTDPQTDASSSANNYNFASAPKKLTLWEVIGKLIDITAAAEEDELEYMKILAGPAYGDALTYTYVLDVHRKAASRLRGILQSLRTVTVEVANEPVVSGLTLLNPVVVPGEDLGKYSYLIKEGYEGTHDLRPQVAMQILKKATASGYAVATTVKSIRYNDIYYTIAAGQIASANAYKNIPCVTHTVTIDKHQDKEPIFVYQMKAVVPMTFGDPVVLHGGHFITSRPLPDEAIAGN